MNSNTKNRKGNGNNLSPAPLSPTTTSLVKRSTGHVMAPIERTGKGLRDALFSEIDSLREGRSNPARARSLALLANSVLESVVTEIEYHKYARHVTDAGGSVAQLGSLELGNKK